jgi:GMP synthase (glutamine-hydrolysing)
MRHRSAEREQALAYKNADSESRQAHDPAQSGSFDLLIIQLRRRSLGEHPRFLLLQVRNAGDPIREHEISCFVRALGAENGQLQIFDLLSGAPPQALLDSVDVVLIGGSGDHSVVRGGPWLPAALDAMVGLYESSKPTFASCWGFQALARALGGEVVTDHERAEVGTVWMALTPEGEKDPVFGPLGPGFPAQIGHEDIVTALPAHAVLLASSETIENEAFCFPDKPIYATQFHPELDRAGLIARISRYPAYLPLTGASTIEEFRDRTPETPKAESLLPRFLEHVLEEVAR